jgi:starch synthase
MPRFGNINERRNQLHEVIRLSGMNLIIDDADHPLIIKVASIQSARMQVYFIDNEDYFNRKFVLKDSKGIFYPDNDERMIFFARGVLETVRKLRWSPDIIHCHGWFTSVVPLYIKLSYKEDPLFTKSRVVFSAYNEKYNSKLETKFLRKVKFDGIKEKDIEIISNPEFINVAKMAFQYSDGIIKGSKNLSPELEKVIKKLKIPVLEYQPPEKYIDAYSVFYDRILND